MRQKSWPPDFDNHSSIVAAANALIDNGVDAILGMYHVDLPQSFDHHVGFRPRHSGAFVSTQTFSATDFVKPMIAVLAMSTSERSRSVRKRLDIDVAPPVPALCTTTTRQSMRPRPAVSRGYRFLRSCY